MSSSSFYHYQEPVLDWSVFYVVTITACTVGTAALALCVACGLFYLAELAEEYTTTAKKCLRYGIVTVAALHGLVLLIDGISLWRSLLSLVALATYYQLLATFPWVKVSSVVSVASMAAFVLDNVAWYSYFMSQSGEFPFWSIVSFFTVMVWAVPLGFFVSLAVTDDRIPAPSTAGGGGQQPGKRTFASFMNILTGRKNTAADY